MPALGRSVTTLIHPRPESRRQALYMQGRTIRLTVMSKAGKEATLAEIALFGLVLRGDLDVNCMNVVGFLGVERDYCEITTEILNLNAGRLARPGGAGLHGINGLGGHL